jgi:hypothetical protein
LEIKEMPLKEKYERLLRETQLIWTACYAFHKEHGTTEKWLDYYANVQKNLLIAGMSEQESIPTFKETVNEVTYDEQKWLPMANLELNWVSDTEATLSIKNCPLTKLIDEVTKKTGLDINAKFVCEKDTTIFPRIVKEFGMDMTHKVTEDGCKLTLKVT